MDETELIERLKEARKLLHKEKDKSVEECMFHYKRILLNAYNGKLRIDPLEFPGGMISDLQNAGCLMESNYRILTKEGIGYVKGELLRSG